MCECQSKISSGAWNSNLSLSVCRLPAGLTGFRQTDGFLIISCPVVAKTHGMLSIMRQRATTQFGEPEMRGRVLLVDQEPQQRLALQAELTKSGFDVVAADDFAAARVAAHTCPPDAIVLAGSSVDGAAADLLAEVRSAHPAAELLVHHRSGSGAAALPVRLSRAIAVSRSMVSAPSGVSFGGVAARSAAMRRVLSELSKIPVTARRVLFVGENGTGKRMLCEALLRERGCGESSVVRVDFERAAVSDDLFRRGDLALTLQRMLPGRIGPRTLVLTRVDLATLGEQEPLARWMHAWKHFFGETHLNAPICSVIATSATPLATLLSGGRFLPALAEQLGAHTIEVPALRDRLDDMPDLIGQHLERIANLIGHPAPTVSREAISTLLGRSWPGNVSELQRVLERVAVYSLNSEIGSERVTAVLNGHGEHESPLPLNDSDAMDRGLNETLAEIERRMILLALRAANGNQGRAAARLKIPRTTLRDRMAKHKIPMHEA